MSTPLSPDEGRFQQYLVLSNIKRKRNLGTLLRSASAFNCAKVIVVGRLKFSTHGAHGAQNHIAIEHFYSFEDARQFLKEHNVTICGVEILDSSKGIETHPFRGSTAFVVGNEGEGLSSEQTQICDHFVHIPHHGGALNPASSLDVTVAASIVMQHFATWANFPIREFVHSASQGKFIVNTRVPFSSKDGIGNWKTEERQKQRNRNVELESFETNLYETIID